MMSYFFTVNELLSCPYSAACVTHKAHSHCFYKVVIISKFLKILIIVPLEILIMMKDIVKWCLVQAESAGQAKYWSSKLQELQYQWGCESADKSASRRGNIPTSSQKRGPHLLDCQGQFSSWSHICSNEKNFDSRLIWILHCIGWLQRIWNLDGM